MRGLPVRCCEADLENCQTHYSGWSDTVKATICVRQRRGSEEIARSFIPGNADGMKCKEADTQFVGRGCPLRNSRKCLEESVI
jgi:hypothetical protein